MRFIIVCFWYSVVFVVARRKGQSTIVFWESSETIYLKASNKAELIHSGLFRIKAIFRAVVTYLVE